MKNSREFCWELVKYSINGELPHWKVDERDREAKLEVLRELERVHTEEAWADPPMACEGLLWEEALDKVRAELEKEPTG